MTALLDREDVEVFPNGNPDSPSTNARVEANRRNALKSTGPKTEEGKTKSRRNALKHGLTGAGIVLPEEDEVRFEEETEQWAKELRARSEHERAMIKALVIAKNRHFRAFEMESRMRVRTARRAATQWEPDQRSAVQRLADKLPKAKTPGLIVEELKATPAGCRWLIERWNELEWALEVNGDWNETCQNLAFDLLGVPRGMREFSVALPFDATIDDKKTLARENIDELTADLEEFVEDSDEEDRRNAMEGKFWDDSPEARRLRSYDERNSRLFQKLLNHFLYRRPEPKEEESEEEAQDEPEPAPAPASAVGREERIRRVHEENPFVRASSLLGRLGILPNDGDGSTAIDPAPAGLSAEELAEMIVPGDPPAALVSFLRSHLARRDA